MMFPKVSQKVRDVIDSELILDNKELLEVMVKFEREVKKGLKKATHNSSEIKNFVTYVQDLPNGNEKGKFLALDLGGTNFRVLLVQMNGEKVCRHTSKTYAIPQRIMVGSGVELFDHIAECMANFVAENNVQNESFPLGFTFSFPIRQLGLTKGLLIKWTKGFTCDGVAGQNVVELLHDAIKRRDDIKICVCAILNDTTGTLMACACKHRNCKIGVILGTGSNACYVEKATNAELFDKPGKAYDEKVVINTEWGGFGDHGSLDFIRTVYDQEVDELSVNPGHQLFEKTHSGMYLGELVRLVLVSLTLKGLLFKGKLPKKLITPNLFLSQYLSEIEVEPLQNSIEVARDILTDLGVDNPSDEDCINVRYVSECISRRAAHLVSAAIATLILRIGEPDITIGVDGSVYRFHPKVHNLMTEKIAELLPSGYHFRLVLAEDGSGRGAALVAAVASRQKHSAQEIHTLSDFQVPEHALN